MTGRRRPPRHGGRPIPATVLVAILLTALGFVLSASPTAAGTGTETMPALTTDPAALVHPLDGTGTGPVSPGTVGEFPGADTPFGMIQWSPDSAPNREQSGGGYDDADTMINGFSLTHLSGTGCPSYQDVPILPTVGPIPQAPADAHAGFAHADERATPGRYHVTLQTPTPVDTTLAVTERTGIASFVFPADAAANVLFKVADGVNPIAAASVTVVGRHEIEGEVTSGQFCQTGTRYTLHFVARFEHPFVTSGTFDNAGTVPASSNCVGTACGAYITFTRPPRCAPF
jgi:putative alpha-1,2-mannosidase